jgi:PAS domain S-box-containing protein
MASWPTGDGEMATCIRSLDWATTPLGESSGWPRDLKLLVDLLLRTGAPAALFWGEDTILIYNDGYRKLLGDKHPAALGRSMAAVSPEIWPVIGPAVREVFATGRSIVWSRALLPTRGSDVLVDRWFDLSLNPVVIDGSIAAIMVLPVETTAQVRLERHQQLLLKLSDATQHLADPIEVQAAAARILGEHLGASRVHYAEVEDDGEHALVSRDYARTAENRAGRYSLASFASLHADVLAGRNFIASVIPEDPRLSDAEKAVFAGLPVAAIAVVPLIKSGQLVAMLAVHMAEPYAWRDDEIAVVEEVAARTWAAVEQARAEEALRDRESRFRLLADAMPHIVWITDGDGRVEFFNRVWADYVGSPEFSENAGDVAETFVHPDDAASTMASFNEARRTGAVFEVEHRIRSAAGDYRWFLVRAEPYRDPASSEIVRWYGASVDIHERKAREAERRAEQERQGFLLKLSDALRPLRAADAIQAETCRLLAEHLGAERAYYADIHDDERQQILVSTDFVAGGAKSLAGSHEIPPFRTVLDLLAGGGTVVTNDVEADDRIQASGHDVYPALPFRSFVCVPMLKDGALDAALMVARRDPYAWSKAEVSLVQDVAERSWTAVERARAEQAQRDSERKATLLLAELQHRVRNILATIRSVARRTYQNARSLQEFGQHLEGRIDSLARTQSLLTLSPGGGVDLQSMILDELHAQSASPDQLRCEGPDVTLAPKTAEVISLAIHELATNSTKYGAISSGAGTISIHWSVAAEGSVNWLHLDWREELESITRLPPRDGFGTELVTRRVPYELGGRGSLSVNEDSLQATIQFPLVPGGSILQTDAARYS